VDRWIDSLRCRLNRSLGRWIGDRWQIFDDSRSNFPARLNQTAHGLGRIGTRPIPSQLSDLKSTLEVKGSRDLISPTDLRSTSMIFNHDVVFDIQSWALITGSTARVVSSRTILFMPKRGCGILPAVAGPPAIGGCCEAIEEMSLWLMAWGVMVAYIYIGWEVGGYMVDLIWYLSVIEL
jgi:hypothetical protein